MGMAITLREYLDNSGVDYEVIPHSYTPTTKAAAEAAHVPSERLAKSVLLEDDSGYVMAVVPACNRVEVQELGRQLGDRRLQLASERELRTLFSDCALGAVPPFGQAYGLDVVWDDSLSACPDIYCEAGDHTDLVHLSGRYFRRLMGESRHGRISRPESLPA